MLIRVSAQASTSGEQRALALLADPTRKPIVALCGAGLSTDSGIPDYRGPKTRRLARQPIRFASFVGDPTARRRYWARAMLGWPRVRDANPNRGHRALAGLEASGHLAGGITQNVDGLAQRAGAKRVIELHGSLHDVGCLACDYACTRQALQVALERQNPGFTQRAAVYAARPNPDGDVELPDELLTGFRVVDCPSCGGPLKPKVVYFGESVPAERVHSAYAWVDAAGALLVLGSSLTVFSGYRFVRRAHERKIPVVIVNRGPTRGDPLAAVKLDTGISSFLPVLSAQLDRVEARSRLTGPAAPHPAHR